MNLVEAVSVIAWPFESPPVPGIQLVVGRALPPAPAIPTEGRPVGTANYPGRERPVALAYDGADRHSLVLGPAGVGNGVHR